MWRWLPWLLIVAEVPLVLTGALGLRDAGVLLGVIEAAVGALIAGRAALAARRHPRGERLRAALDAVVPPIVARLMRHELRVFAALGRGIARRREAGPGELVVTYAGNLLPFLVGMCAVSLVELWVVHVLVPWPWLEWTLAILGVYGTIWLAGLACSAYTRPHTLTEGRLRLRYLVFTQVDVVAERLEPVATTIRGSHKDTVEVEDGTLSFSTLGTTNAAVRVEPPAEVDLGRAGRHVVHTVRFYADDPKRLTRTLTQTQPDLNTGT
ncbi:hypothetical protein [Dactylosporangium sp. CS-033363]|uniref:hypothetical protein n=1 Tax=Dactylosporangium sp. CS-033363 TaxID=3239935 RepID=UPI003D8CB764